MTEYHKMLAGKPFNSRSIAIRNIMGKAQQALLACRSMTPDVAQNELRRILKQLPSTAFIVTPAHFDYGINVSLGEHSFVNTNSVFLDVGRITIGSHCMIGDNVTFAAVNHVISPYERLNVGAYVIDPLPIKIGNNVWIGSGARILGGTVIGDNCNIAAGSIVSGQFPPGSLIAGNPATIKKSYAQ